MQLWLLLTEEEAVDLVSGFCPPSVKGQVLGLLDYKREDERRANRPVRKPAKRQTTKRERVSV